MTPLFAALRNFENIAALFLCQTIDYAKLVAHGFSMLEVRTALAISAGRVNISKNGVRIFCTMFPSQDDSMFPKISRVLGGGFSPGPQPRPQPQPASPRAAFPPFLHHRRMPKSGRPLSEAVVFSEFVFFDLASWYGNDASID